ncbi:MAG: hypothetical protein BroJett030_15770 [Alphaproteobacteria bacterium]|nr:MAG: hypothetical protein BroJett030_15770 [Alphaproteobacteria bacterium]
MTDHEEISARSPLRAALLSAGVIAAIFGLATVVSGGRALFGGAAARAAVGDAVPFVLWFNTLAGFAYVAAGVGLLMRRRWAVWLSALVAATTLAVFAAFAAHVLAGGAYEMRTVSAMTLRSLVWIAIAVLAWRSIGPEGGR